MIKLRFLAAAASILMLSACGSFAETASSAAAQSDTSAVSASEAQTQIQTEAKANSAPSVREDSDMELTVNGKSFTAVLEENDTAAAFRALLPLTLDMSELNGNEKYFYLDTALPSAPEKAGHINAGDIMLYGSSCIVVFYESFDTPYSYTKIGQIADTAGLAEALGTGNVTVSFQAAASEYTLQDVTNLRDFLLGAPTAESLGNRQYDLDGNGRWNACDLTLMKRQLLPEKSDILVAYFSRTGNTEKIAQYLIDLTGADSYVIEAAVPYTDADIHYQDDTCRANMEQNDKAARPEIADPPASVGSYDVIFLGYPIWWGEEPRIIDTFLEGYDFSEKTVIPFCTSGSSGISASEKNIAALVPIGNQPAGRRFPAGAAAEDVRAWLDTLALS